MSCFVGSLFPFTSFFVFERAGIRYIIQICTSLSPPNNSTILPAILSNLKVPHQRLRILLHIHTLKKSYNFPILNAKLLPHHQWLALPPVTASIYWFTGDSFTKNLSSPYTRQHTQKFHPVDSPPVNEQGTHCAEWLLEPYCMVKLVKYGGRG